MKVTSNFAGCAAGSAVACKKLANKLANKLAKLTQHIRLSVFIVLLLQSNVSQAASRWSMVYVYEKPDGSHLMTSSRLKHTKYRLVKTYKTRKVQKKVAHKGLRAKPLHSVCNKERMRVRADKYRRPIEVYSRIYGVDESLVHSIIKNESCYQVKAKSPVGAIGLMQLMPATAKDMMISNPWDPEQNIQGGVRYIAEMLKEFNGDLKLAVAAYNAGPGNVHKHNGVPPFRETRTYVKRVIADYQRLSTQYASLLE